MACQHGEIERFSRAEVRFYVLALQSTDKKLRELRSKQRALLRKMVEVERKIPQDVRDLDTLESHLAGETTGNDFLQMESFMRAYPVLEEYGKLLLSKFLLDRNITRRATEISKKLLADLT